MIPLLLALFHHITFDGRKPTVYENRGAVLAAHVDASASFLFEPFAAIRKVSTLRFSWRIKNGAVKTPNAAAEAEKSGDDLPVRIGLLISGKAPLMPFFAPSWIKAVSNVAKLPASKLVFVVAGAKHAPGASWPSPFDDDLLLIAADDRAERDGWHVATHAFLDPLAVVGLWIMSDGDATASRFDVEIKDLELE